MRSAKVRHNDTELKVRKRLSLAVKIRRHEDQAAGNRMLTLAELKWFKRHIGLRA